MCLRLGLSAFLLIAGIGYPLGFENLADLQPCRRQGDIPGILARSDGQAVGWCSLGPRESFPALERSRALKRIDDEPSWSVTCLFVKKEFRNRGVSVQLLKAAIKQARAQGASHLEGYPVEPKSGRTADAFAWTGLVSAFLQAGFEECARNTPSRPIMRYSIGTKPKSAAGSEPVGDR